MSAGFGARLAASVAARGPLCAGIDPHPGLIESWGLPLDVSGLERFALNAAEVLGSTASIVKPQSAFFEAFGPGGVAVLERVIDTVHDAGALVLLDVKRGDIGSTMAAYTAAYVAEKAAFTADAATVSPYLGFGSLDAAVASAREAGNGLFVLARTSNPEAHALQRARLEDGRTVAQSVVDAAAEHNAGMEPHGDVGVVVGATVAPGEVDLTRLNGPVLAPGFGAQGATVADLHALFGPGLPGVLPASSRDLLRHGPDSGALRRAAQRVADQLAGTRESGH